MAYVIISETSMEILGLDAEVVGALMFFGGGIIAGIGSGMSKAARKRHERGILMGDHFNFGSVQGPAVAGTGNTVAGGDQYTAGRDLHIQNTITAEPEALKALDRLQEELSAAPLTDEQRETAALHITAIKQASTNESAAKHLEALTRVLKATSDAAGAGTNIIGLVTALAGWFGPLGAGVLALL